MKTLSRSLHALLAGLLTLVLIFGLCCPTASALTAEPVEYPATSAPPSRQPSMIVSGLRYNPEGNAIVVEFKLDDASKLSLLMEYIFPVDYLVDELSNLKIFLHLPRTIDSAIYSWQLEAGTLRSWLSAETQTAYLSCDNAYEGMLLLKTRSEYQNNPNVKRFVDEYLTYSLGADQLRWALSKLYAEFDVKIDPYSLNPVELRDAAEAEVASERFQTLMKAMTPLENGAKYYQALVANFSSEQLSDIYADLRSVGQTYWPNYIRQLDNARLAWSIPMTGVTSES